jgi:hypothetical protein
MSPKLLKPPNPKHYLACTAILVLLPRIQAWRLIPGHDPRLKCIGTIDLNIGGALPRNMDSILNKQENKIMKFLCVAGNME